MKKGGIVMLGDRWFPFYDIEKTLDEVDRIFSAAGRPLELRSVPRGTFPTVNIYDRGNNLLLQAEIPGVDIKDLELSVVDNTLTLKGQRKIKDPGRNEQFHRRERLMGTFERTISLPVQVDTGSVKANYRNGILEVDLTKSQETKPKTIQITGS
jgi:HSP20 family protein